MHGVFQPRTGEVQGLLSESARLNLESRRQPPGCFPSSGFRSEPRRFRELCRCENPLQSLKYFKTLKLRQLTHQSYIIPPSSYGKGSSSRRITQSRASYVKEETRIGEVEVLSKARRAVPLFRSRDCKNSGERTSFGSYGNSAIPFLESKAREVGEGIQ